MYLAYQLGSSRRSPGQRLLVTLGLGLATFLASALLFGAAVYENVVPSFDERISLSSTRILEVGVVPGCPPAMPEIACLHIEQLFPRAFRVVYWSADEKVTLLSIDLPQR
jgi:hypothetical protein